MRSCDIGDPRTCYEAGQMYADHARAADAYDVACRSGRAVACTSLGHMYSKGDGVMKDAKRAAQLYERGCGAVRVERPDGLACYSLSNILRDGIGVPVDTIRAGLLAQQACSLGVEQACASIRKPSS